MLFPLATDSPVLSALQLLSQAGPIELHSSNCFGGFTLNPLQLVYKPVLNLDSGANSWSSEPLPPLANREARLPSVVEFSVFLPLSFSLSHFSPSPPIIDAEARNGSAT